METNIEKFTEAVLQRRDQEWETLKATKFSQCSPEVLEIMSTVWSHGFSKAIEIQSELSSKLYADSKKQS